MEKIAFFTMHPRTESSPRCNAGHVERRFHGGVTFKMLKSFLEEVYSHGTCTGEGTLLDFTGATIDLHFTDMLSVTEWEKRQPRRPFTRLALVVDNMVSYGVGRMYSTLASDLHETRVFRDKDDAVQWLK